MLRVVEQYTLVRIYLRLLAEEAEYFSCEFSLEFQ